MSYTPTNWQNGDTITADKLNKMEGGIENASDSFNDIFEVTLTPTDLDYSGTMDKTPGEIYTAFMSGKRIRFVVPALNSLFDASTYRTSGFAVEVNAQFVFFEPNSQSFFLLNVTTSKEESEYRTVLFPLTPAT